MYNETCEKCNRSGFEYLINGMCSKCAKEELDSLQSQLDAARGEAERLWKCLDGIHVSLIALCFVVRQGGEVHLETLEELKQEAEQALQARDKI